MQRRVMVAAVMGAAAITGGGAVWTHAATMRERAAYASHPAGFTELAERDVQISVWHKALDADPTSAIVLGQLAALHAQRAREGGTWDDYVQAESYARRSIAKRTRSPVSPGLPRARSTPT